MSNGLWLEDGDVRVHQLALGCITRDWQIGGKSAVLGYQHPEAYEDNPYYMGAIVGRVANRIGAASFILDGHTHNLCANEGRNMLHGGPGGLSTQTWDMDRDGSDGVMYRITSPDGDQGFPGKLDVDVRVTLSGHTVTWDMRALPDRPTPVSLAQHNYYALGGASKEMVLQVDACRYTPIDDESIPTGDVATLPPEMDFRKPRPIGHDIDHNYALPSAPTKIKATGDNFALSMTCDQPGVQVYTSQFLQPHHPSLPGQTHTPHAAIALEPQGWPDAVNKPDFPVIIATPDQPYRQRLSVSITPR